MSPIDLIRLQQLEADASAMRAARKSSSSDQRNLTERANMHGLVYNAINAGLWYNFARTKLLRHRSRPLCQSGPSQRFVLPKQGRIMEFHWIRVHWFEVSALVLLGLNLWFVIKVLSVLRAVQDGLILLARWLNIARSEVNEMPAAGLSKG